MYDPWKEITIYVPTNHNVFAVSICWENCHEIDSPTFSNIKVQIQVMEEFYSLNPLLMQIWQNKNNPSNGKRTNQKEKEIKTEWERRKKAFHSYDYIMPRVFHFITIKAFFARESNTNRNSKWIIHRNLVFSIWSTPDNYHKIHEVPMKMKIFQKFFFAFFRSRMGSNPEGSIPVSAVKTEELL